MEGAQLGVFQDGHCDAGHDDGYGHKSENRAENQNFCTALAGPVSYKSGGHRTNSLSV